MADIERELLDDVLTGAKTMATLARDEEVFRAAVDAFRAEDGESMGLLLKRHELLDRCELICRWLRSKETVLLCLELAGPPPPEQVDEPEPLEFAQLVARLTTDEDLVDAIACAVQDRDAVAWAELIEKNSLQRFSRLLCHWVSTVHYRLVCEVVCRPFPTIRPRLVEELVAAGQGVGRLAADRELFADAEKAVLANNCQGLAGALERGDYAPFCSRICEWFCSWRCFLACRRLCLRFPIERVQSPVGEMLQFARATGRLADEGALERLAAATLREDVKLVEELSVQLKFERYCLQFCHWVCFLRCQRFCFCVCPPRTIGVFTKIGGLYYTTDVASADPGSGLTVSDKRAFYSTLRLNGGLSVVDGAPLIEYRFQTIPTSDTGSPTGSWQPVTPAQIAPTNIGSFIRPIPVLPFSETIPVWVNSAAAGVFNIVPSADGWIKVPPMFPGAPMVTGLGWRFVPGSDLINLNTTTLTPFVASIDETGVTAGSSANTGVPGAPLLQTNVHHGIRMRIRNQGNSGTGTNAGTCGHIAINNTHYDNISHHPYWPGGLFGATDELAVASLGIAELVAAPCSLLTTSLTPTFTAAHSNLGAVTMSMEGPGGPYPFALNPVVVQNPGENWFGAAVPGVNASFPSSWTFAKLSPCAYLLKLSVTALLTTGDGVPAALVDYIAFCKG